MKQIWITDDGRQFDSKEEASRHEESLTLTPYENWRLGEKAGGYINVDMDNHYEAARFVYQMAGEPDPKYLTNRKLRDSIKLAVNAKKMYDFLETVSKVCTDWETKENTQDLLKEIRNTKV